MERKHRRGGFYNNPTGGHPLIPAWIGKILAPIIALGIIGSIIKAAFFD
jgi:hypothetical protein